MVEPERVENPARRLESHPAGDDKRNTAMAVETFLDRLSRRYGASGPEIDPELNKSRRRFVKLSDKLSELSRLEDELRKEIDGLRRNKESLDGSVLLIDPIFDAVQDGLCVLDKNLNIVKVNPTMREWYSHARPLAGRKCHEVRAGRSEPCLSCPTLRALRTGKMEKAEIPLFKKKGVAGVLELFAYPFSDETGSLIGVIEYARDITRQAQLEKGLRLQIKNLIESNSALRNRLKDEDKVERDAEASTLDFMEVDRMDGGIIQSIDSYAAAVDFSDIEKLDQAHKNIIDASDSNLEPVDRSNAFDEWRILLETIAADEEYATTNHRKLLGCLLTVTHHRDVTDFDAQSLGLLKKATSTLRQPLLTEKKCGETISEMIENGFHVVIPLAPDDLREDAKKELDEMMADLLARSD